MAACARTNFHVLIIGESGSGKELAAQAIHNLSRRAGKKLIADNIAAAEGVSAVALHAALVPLIGKSRAALADRAAR